MTIRSFIDLFPSRLDQALTSDSARRSRVDHKRLRSSSKIACRAKSSRKLFVDMSVISVHDAGTGIQRVVRALAAGLASEMPSGWCAQFVAANRHQAYHNIDWPNIHPGLPPHQMEGQAGDVFLGLDYSLDTVRWYERQLCEFRRSGGKIWFLIHDLLPLERPDWFKKNTVIRYKRWLEIIASIGDGFLCNSADTETKFRRAMNDMYGLTEGFSTKILPMGYEIQPTMLHSGVPDVVKRSAQLRISGRFFLMVGTLEPRKGYADIIAAFDAIWQKGFQERLVLVGRMGWRVDKLKHLILAHPEYGRQLFWFDDVEDSELERFYETCEGVIVASHAEGFGLPVIEALGRSRPVLARELLVFKPHAKYGARYFPVDATAQTLAACVVRWAEDIRAGRVSIIQPDESWRQSTLELIETIALAESGDRRQNPAPAEPLASLAANSCA